MSTVMISTKGQIVIPSHLRQKYGIKAPGRALITEKDGQIVIVPLPTDPIVGARGMLKSDQSLAESQAAYKQEERRLEEDHEERLP